MPQIYKRKPRFPIKLTLPQRKQISAWMSTLTSHMQLDKPDPLVVDLNLHELTRIKGLTEKNLLTAPKAQERKLLESILKVTDKTISESEKPTVKIYQFKITLLEIDPPIWRRIQIEDTTLDGLHSHIQNAMGWDHDHFYEFKIRRQTYESSSLVDDQVDFDADETLISEIVPKNHKPLRFDYTYDLGDCWRHEILFEKIMNADPLKKYPLCLEGARACPPEDCGGSWSYAEKLAALADPDHDDHYDCIEWFGDEYDPEEFSAKVKTKDMQ